MALTMEADVTNAILSGSEESCEAGRNPRYYRMRPHTRFFVVFPGRTPQNDIEGVATYFINAISPE